MRARAASLACFGAVAAGCVWLLSDAVLAGRILSPGDLTLFAVPPFGTVRPAGLLRAANPSLTDIVFVIEPYLLHAREAIRGGSLPLWDPNVGTGRPLGAQAAAQLFPTSWLAYVLPFWRSLGFIALAKLLLCAGGTFLFARSLRLRPAAAGVAAATFALGSQYVVWLGHSMTDVVALMPWMFLFVERICAHARVADAAGLGLSLGIAMYGGHPESLVVALSGSAAYLAARLRYGGTPIAPRLRLAAGALVLGGAVGALYWLPLLELLGQSARTARANPPDSLRQLAVGLVFPEWWGRPDKTIYDAGGGGGLSSVFVGRAYIGVVPLLLCVGGLALPRRRAQRFFAVAGFASLALIVDLPVARWVATHVPPFSVMVVHYFIWLAAFSLALLAGIGLEQFLAASRERQRRALRAMAAGAALPVVLALALHGGELAGAAGGALRQLPVQRLDPGSAAVAAAGSLLRFGLVAGLALGTACLALRYARLRAAALGFVLLLGLADLVTIDRGYQPALPRALADPAAPQAVALAPGETRGRLVAPGLDLSPNLAELYGHADVRVEDLPELARYSAVVEALGGSVLRAFGDSLIPPDRELGEPGATGSSRTLLDLLGASQIVDAGGSPPTGPGLRISYASPGQRLIANAQALPRAFGAYSWQPVGGLDAAVAALRGRTAAELARRPAIEGAPTPPPGRAPAIATARIAESSDTAVTVVSDLARPGYVVLDDLYYPGWSARLDGRPAKILPANGAFRAVAAGAGRHVVRFAYRPASVLAGAALTALGLLGGLGAIALAGAGARRRHVARAHTSGRV